MGQRAAARTVSNALELGLKTRNSQPLSAAVAACSLKQTGLLRSPEITERA